MRTAERLLRPGDRRTAGRVVPGRRPVAPGSAAKRALGRTGKPIEAGVRGHFERRLGHDLGEVRIHSDATAAQAARSTGARAFAVGRQLVFGEGEYAPHSVEGRRLLAHELVHVIQQRKVGTAPPRRVSSPSEAAEREADAVAGETASDAGGPIAVRAQAPVPVVQRELLAYTHERTEYLPSFGGGTSTSYMRYSADAPDIERALRPLIAAGKIGTRTEGDHVYFFGTGAAKGEIVTALTAAGYRRAGEMSDAILSAHSLSLYTGERVTEMSHLFGTSRIGRSTDLIASQRERPLTHAERGEARLVFGSSLDYARIRVAEDPILSVGGYARTLPWAVYFPPGSFGRANFVPWLIHELTHSWQYQHGVSLFTTIYHALEADYDYGGAAGLRASLASGKKFTEFTTEEQGDILSDYYVLLKAGGNISAHQPYVTQMRAVP